MIILLSLAAARAQEPLQGDLAAHDPSPMVECNGAYFIYATGQNIISKKSVDRLHWVAGPAVFDSANFPRWTTNAVPGFTGFFWAPDVVLVNGRYCLYYAVSTFGSQVSAIGLATNSTLDPSVAGYRWVDQGPVIQSSNGYPFNAIDPGVLPAADGKLWMSFGSFWNGVYLAQLDPATGLRLPPPATIRILATHPPSTAIEASCLAQRGAYYYLFVNWDACCEGVDSTYNIRVGRSTNIAGPFLDKNGVSMAQGGGTLLLGGAGRFIGPGQAGIFLGPTNWFTYHYYDGNNNGNPTLGMASLTWSADNWPVLNQPPTPVQFATNNAAVVALAAAAGYAESVNYTMFAADGSSVAADVVLFPPGSVTETISLPALQPGGFYRVTLSNPAGCVLTGITNAYVAGAGPSLGVAHFPGEQLIYWAAAGARLQQADDPGGPWRYATNLASPIRLPESGAAAYFRLFP
ncbi:MAG TPA: arabinan endo-1,5-alpha-L-arabinosidase [Verrucomicrobiae bacterium]|nr:arabinan endo-1,5-alpha-L-arabinosidase [Verrucomicrobiae bacterium]